MAGRNLGTIVGALIGGAAGYLTARKYETALTAFGAGVYFFGAGAYVIPIGLGAIALGYVGKKLYNKEKTK